MTRSENRQHAVAGDFQRIGGFIANVRSLDLRPVRSDGDTAIVEIPALPRFGEADQRIAPALSGTRRRADKPDEIRQGETGHRQNLGNTFRGRPARLSLRVDAFALVKGR